MAKTRWRSELCGAARQGGAARRSARAFRVACLALALALPACSDRERERAAASEPEAALPVEEPPRALLELNADASTPRALLESLLVAARQTRIEQALAAQISWNTVADLLARVGGESPFLADLRRSCPHVEDATRFAALEWTWLAEREIEPSASGAERRRLCFALQGHGISMQPPCPSGTPLAIVLRLPVWTLRRLLPPGAPHPVRPRFSECVRGEARPRTWLLAVDVQRTPDGWRFDGAPYWIEGLLLLTDPA